ncbi:MAG: M1 family metallopeptidase [Ignavibacteria bacterium]|nr:M1 family metallopeptidase [Ignavibacteria bacterium]
MSISMGFMKNMLLLLAVVLPTIMWAQSPYVHTSTYIDAPGSEPRERPVDIERMTLDVRFVPEQGLIKGKVTHVFNVLQKQVDTILFDAVSIDIKTVTLGRHSLRYRSTDTSVIVYCEPPLTWDTKDSITFTYEAKPRKGIYFVGWNDPSKRMRKQIWTQGQGIDNRHWIPMYDEMNDKMITETITTFDSSYAVLSNGTHLGTKVNTDGTKTWHYTMTRPHASYLLMLAIGHYTVTERISKSGVKQRLYSYPEYPERIEPTYRYSSESMDFLEEYIGIPYPWELYSQVPVADYIFGAMENTTATIFGDFSQTDARGWLDRSYVGTNVHELTHQWFGDLVTARSQKSVWLQESFATYYPHVFTRKTPALGGEDGYQWGRRGMHKAALGASEKDRLPIVNPTAGSARIYPKGAAVLDMMAYTFGEDALRRVIKNYLEKHMYQTVETNDLYLAFQDTLGLSPEWFFDQWLYKGGEPHYKVSWSTSAMQQGASTIPSTRVDVEQIHHMDELTGPFRMPIVVEAWYSDNSHDRVRVDITSKNAVVQVPNPRNKQVAFVLFDPASYVMKKLSFDKGWDEKLAQVKHAPNMIDRYDALEAMRGDSTRGKERIAVLKDALQRETFSAMRSEVVQQAAELARNGFPEAWELVKVGLEDKQTDVRKAAINSVSVIPENLRSAFERLLADSSYQIIQTVLTKLATSFPKRTESYTGKVKDVRGPHERVRIARLEIDYANGKAAALEELADLAGPGWEFITRQNAMGALKRLGSSSSLAVENMLQALFSTNNRLSAVALSTLTTLSEITSNRLAIRQIVEKQELTKSQKQLVEPLVR